MHPYSTKAARAVTMIFLGAAAACQGYLWTGSGRTVASEWTDCPVEPAHEPELGGRPALASPCSLRLAATKLFD